MLFAVLCGAASYIAVPAVQRLAIPEASPTLPLAASLGLTFSYNVTIGIPIYIEIANALVEHWFPDHLNAPSTHPASSCRHEMSANHPRPQSELVPPRPCGANAPFGAVSKADRSRAVAVPATVGNDSAQPIQCRVVYGSVLFVHSDAVKLWGIGS